MHNKVADLMLRNLQEVFNERDAARRSWLNTPGATFHTVMGAIEFGNNAEEE